MVATHYSTDEGTTTDHAFGTVSKGIQLRFPQKACFVDVRLYCADKLRFLLGCRKRPVSNNCCQLPTATQNIDRFGSH